MVPKSCPNMDEGNYIEVGMDDFLRDTLAMEGMLLDVVTHLFVTLN
jgi:hypothetical protein